VPVVHRVAVTPLEHAVWSGEEPIIPAGGRRGERPDPCGDAEGGYVPAVPAAHLRAAEGSGWTRDQRAAAHRAPGGSAAGVQARAVADDSGGTVRVRVIS